MPTVPTYDSLQAQTSGVPTPHMDASNFDNDTGQQLQQAGAGLTRAGAIGQRIAEEMAFEANKPVIEDRTNQAVKLDTDLRTHYLQLRGRNALELPDGKSLPDAYADDFDKGAEEIAKSLHNDMQREAFASHVAQIKAGGYRTLSTHMVDQQRAFHADTQAATIKIAADRGALLWGDATAYQESIGAIRATVDQQAADNGWDKDQKEVALAESMTPLHVGVMKSMIQGGMATRAQAYYDEHSATMTLQARATMQSVLKDAGDSQVGEAGADAVWNSLGPRGMNDPVRIFDMEQAAREHLKDNPEAMKRAIDGLRQRAQAFNAQQTEMKAQTTAGAWRLVDSGASMADVEKSDAWLAMTDTERHTMRKQITAEQAQQAGNELTILQRDERLNLMMNGDKFLTATDPDVLANMSRAQVEAMRGQFGMEATQHLLQKWDTLQKPEKIIEARMDTEDFNSVADSLGLHPYKPGTEADKRKLGTLKYRMEQLIDLEQRQVKRPLDRQEKAELMRREMARTVTLGHWYGDKQVPVAQLTTEDLPDVVVPMVERAKIVEALQSAYRRNPKDPRYAPNEANVRRLYLMGRSPAAGFINGE